MSDIQELKKFAAVEAFSIQFRVLLERSANRLAVLDSGYVGTPLSELISEVFRMSVEASEAGDMKAQDILRFVHDRIVQTSLELRCQLPTDWKLPKKPAFKSSYPAKTD